MVDDDVEDNVQLFLDPNVQVDDDSNDKIFRDQILDCRTWWKSFDVNRNLIKFFLFLLPRIIENVIVRSDRCSIEKKWMIIDID